MQARAGVWREMAGGGMDPSYPRKTETTKQKQKIEIMSLGGDRSHRVRVC